MRAGVPRPAKAVRRAELHGSPGASGVACTARHGIGRGGGGAGAGGGESVCRRRCEVLLGDQYVEKCGRDA